ncbi:unnamed protein product [Urochloa humidicola]
MVPSIYLLYPILFCSSHMPARDPLPTPKSQLRSHGRARRDEAPPPAPDEGDPAARGYPAGGARDRPSPAREMPPPAAAWREEPAATELPPLRLLGGGSCGRPATELPPTAAARRDEFAPPAAAWREEPATGDGASTARL